MGLKCIECPFFSCVSLGYVSGILEYPSSKSRSCITTISFQKSFYLPQAKTSISKEAATRFVPNKRNFDQPNAKSSLLLALGLLGDTLWLLSISTRSSSGNGDQEHCRNETYYVQIGRTLSCSLR